MSYFSNELVSIGAFASYCMQETKITQMRKIN